MEIKIDVEDGKSGAWEVSSFQVSKSDADLHNMREAFHGGRFIKAGEYKKLTRNGQIIMSNTQAEISDHVSFIYRARKSRHILINGLGLGVALKAILESDVVENVTIIEKSPDVIKLVAKYYANDPRVEILNHDAFNFKPKVGIKYDVVWHDIWDNICVDNIPEMIKLHRKYGRRTDWQGSWARGLCERYRAVRM